MPPQLLQTPAASWMQNTPQCKWIVRLTSKHAIHLHHHCFTSIFHKITMCVLFRNPKHRSLPKNWNFIYSELFPHASCVLLYVIQTREGKKPTYYSFILTHFYYWFRVGNGAKPSKHWAKYWTEGKKIPWLAVIELGQYSPTGKEEINFLPVYCNISHNNSKPIVAHWATYFSLF